MSVNNRENSVDLWADFAGSEPEATVTADVGHAKSEANDLLLIAGETPGDFERPTPYMPLPQGESLRDETDQYSQGEYHALFNIMDDQEAIATAHGIGGPAATRRERQSRLSNRKKQEYYSLEYPENDPGKMAMQLGGPYSLEHIEELQKTTSGKASLKKIWIDAQFKHLHAELEPEFRMFEARAISGDAALQLADCRRFSEDIFGGKLRAGINLGKDFLASGADMIGRGIVGAGRAFFKHMQASPGGRTDLIDSYNHYTEQSAIRKKQRENPDREITAEDIADDINPLPLMYGPFQKIGAEYAVEHADELLSAINRLFYRPEARTGLFLYDKGLSPVIHGLGTVGASMAMFAVNPFVAIAAMYGANKEEIRSRILTDGGSEDDAELYSGLYAVLSTMVDYSNINRFIRLTRTASPVKSYFGNAIGLSALSEGGEEFSQRLVGSAAVEHSRSQRSDYQGFDAVRFMGEFLPDALEDGLYGSITGGVVGGMSGGPLNTARRQVWYSKTQRFIDGGIERLNKAPELRQKPAEMKRIIHDITEKSNAPKSLFIPAKEVEAFFGGDTVRQQRALEALDVTPQGFAYAQQAGAQVEVSSEGLIQHCFNVEQDADLRRLARPDPDAPTLAILAEQMLAENEVIEELEKVRSENKGLPSQFKIFRDQLVEAGRDHEVAQQEADLNYAMATVAGRRRGLTAEQFIDLNPIKVLLSNQVETARQTGKVADAIEDGRFESMATAAQAAYIRHQNESNSERYFVSSTNGGQDFGVISPEMTSTESAQQAGFSPGVVRVQTGSHDSSKPSGHQGFGLRHIAERLGLLQDSAPGSEAESAALDEARVFIESVTSDPDAVFDVGGDRFGLVKRDVNNRLIIIEALKEHVDGQIVYTAITGGVRKKIAAKYRLLWAKNSSFAASPEATPSQSESAGNASGTSESRELGTKAAETNIDISTIPATNTDVKWMAESLKTILDSSGILPEHRDAFSKYIQTLLDNNADVSDVGRLTREFETAIMMSEGLEQAAQGIKHVLSDPGKIGQAVLDELGIDAPSIQEGMAEMSRRIIDLERRATRYRYFHTDPDAQRNVQTMAEGLHHTGQRGDATFTPDINIIRVFSGRQNHSTVAHELFHIYGDHLIRDAKAENASEQTRRDFEALNAAVGGGLDSADPDIRRMADEKVARMFEKYMSEGIAPSPGLAGAFQRFRMWMTNVYRGVREFADIEIAPDVREVFDRMIGTEADIEQARLYYHDLENLAPPTGISPEQAERLGRGVERARQTSEAKQFAKMMDWMLGGHEGRKTIRRQIQDGIKTSRQYRVIAALKLMGGISYEEVANEIGDAEAKRIQNTSKGLIKDSIKERRDNADRLERLAKEYNFGSLSKMAEDFVMFDPPALLAEKVMNLGGFDELYFSRIFGQDVVDEMYEKYGEKIFRREGGIVGAINVADQFGYGSIQEMFEDAARFPGYREATNALYEQRITQEEVIARQAMETGSATIADEAHHNDDLSRAMAIKQAMLHQQAKEQAEREGRRIARQLNDAALRRIAAEAVASRAERKATQYFTAVSAFKKHALAAAKADAKGDKITAAQEYQQMRLAHYEIREAMHAQKDSDLFRRKHTSTQAWVKRLEGSDRNKMPPVESGFSNAIKGILTRWKVVTSPRLAPDGDAGGIITIPGPNAAIDPEIAAITPSVAEYIPPWILSTEGADNIHSWRDLTMEQIRQLGDALDVLTEQGKGEMRALQMPGIRTIRQAVDESIRRMKERPDRPSQYGRGTENDGRKDKFRNWKDWFLVGAMVPEYTMAIADGNTNITGQGVGPLQTMALALRKGIENKNTLFVRDLQKIAPAMKALRKFSRRFRSMDKTQFGMVPESLRAVYGESLQWDGEMMVMVALNCGTATNLKAITQGYGMDGEQVSRIFSAFTAAEMDAIQTIWDVVGGHFQEIDDTHFLLTNRRTEKVQPQKFTAITSDGITREVEGGYFPLQYDGQVDREIGGRQDYEVSLNANSYAAVRGMPKPKNGFTMVREGAARPPVLRLDAIHNHLDKVAHYIHLAETIKEANAITANRDWEAMFVRKFGDARYRSIRKYIKNIADPDSGSLGKNDVGRKFLEWVRHKGTTAALGFKVKSALKQRLDVFPAIAQMSMHSRNGSSGLKYALIGMREIGFAGNIGIMNDRISAIYEKSSFMRDAEGNVTADMREILAKARTGSPLFEIAGKEVDRAFLSNLAYALMTSQDRASRAAIWAGAYQMAMDGNADFDPMGMKDGDTIERVAIDFADRMAANFSATTAADLTEWQRDKGAMRMFTTFLSGTVRRSSRLIQYLDAYKMGHMDGATAAKAFVMDAAIQSWIPAFMAMGLNQLFGGDDDDEITMGGIAFDVFFDPMLSVIDGVPLFNTASSFVRYGRGSVFTPSGLHELGRRATQAKSIPTDVGKGEYGKAGRKALGIGGYLTGVPAENAWRDFEKLMEALGVKSKR